MGSAPVRDSLKCPSWKKYFAETRNEVESESKNETQHKPKKYTIYVLPMPTMLNKEMGVMIMMMTMMTVIL